MNYSGFFDKGNKYVDFDVNLYNISSPDQYSIAFYALDAFRGKNSYCTLVDVTDLIHIPPPGFTISAAPSSVALRPGEKTDIELQLTSETNLDSKIILSINQINDRLKLDLKPSQISVLPKGIATSHLEVQVLEGMSPGIYTMPITANISFPTIVTTPLNEQIFKNPESASISKNSNITITVQEPLGVIGQFRVIWDEMGSPLGEFVSF